MMRCTFRCTETSRLSRLKFLLSHRGRYHGYIGTLRNNDNIIWTKVEKKTNYKLNGFRSTTVNRTETERFLIPITL